MSREPASLRFDSIPRMASQPAVGSVPASEADVLGTTPNPSPSSWSRWGLRLLTPTILLVALVGGHQIWSWQAKRQLKNFVDVLRQNGEPVSVTQFQSVPIPDEKNGAADLRAAGEAVVPDADAWQGIRLPLSDREVEFVRTVLAANTEFLSRLAAARSKPGLHWNSVLESRGRYPSWGGRGSGLFRSRGLSQLLLAAALLAHQDGDDRLAIQRVNDLLYIARAAAGRPAVQSQQSSLWLHIMAFRALNEILPELAIGTGPADVPQEQVRALLARIQDERESLNAILNCLRSERARYIDSVLLGPMAAREAAGADAIMWGETLPMPWPYSQVERWLTQPVQFGRSKEAIERLNAGIASFQQPSLRDFLDANDISEGDDYSSDAPRSQDNTLRPLMSVLDRLGREHYECLARRRVTTLALAATLYHAEHNAWPRADLAGIAPAYLPQIPADPLSTCGEQILFIADADRPRVYSVGDDGIDDGGWPAELSSFPTLRPENPAMSDWVVDLVRQPQKTAAAGTGS
jgi:hypothetical protein